MPKNRENVLFFLFTKIWNFCYRNFLFHCFTQQIQIPWSQLPKCCNQLIFHHHPLFLSPPPHLSLHPLNILGKFHYCNNLSHFVFHNLCRLSTNWCWICFGVNWLVGGVFLLIESLVVSFASQCCWFLFVMWCKEVVLFRISDDFSGLFWLWIWFWWNLVGIRIGVFCLFFGCERATNAMQITNGDGGFESETYRGCLSCI